MVNVAIYVEGGGKGGNNAKRLCREGFGRFFARLLGVSAPRVKVIASGSRSEAYRDFCRSLTNNLHEATFLLVDAEDVVAERCGKWEHVRQRNDDKWAKPLHASELHLHFMSTCMEVWLISDINCFCLYYGNELRSDQLFPRQTCLEEISKADIERALRTATRNSTKGGYHKTRHGFDLLANTDPAKVRARCARFAAPFFDELTAAVKS